MFAAVFWFVTSSCRNKIRVRSFSCDLEHNQHPGWGFEAQTVADNLVIWYVVGMEVAPKNNLSCVCAPTHHTRTLPRNNNVVPVVAGQIILGTPKIVWGGKIQTFKDSFNCQGCILCTKQNWPHVHSSRYAKSALNVSTCFWEKIKDFIHTESHKSKATNFGYAKCCIHLPARCMQHLAGKKERAVFTCLCNKFQN